MDTTGLKLLSFELFSNIPALPQLSPEGPVLLAGHVEEKWFELGDIHPSVGKYGFLDVRLLNFPHEEIVLGKIHGLVKGALHAHEAFSNHGGRLEFSIEHLEQGGLIGEFNLPVV